MVFSNCSKNILPCVAGAMMSVVVGGGIAARAAVISSVATGSFSDNSVLMLPTGGYAVDFGNTTSTATTGSSAGASTGVTFEGGPAATAAGTNSSTTSSGDLTLSLVGGSSTTKIGSSSSYLGTTTTPTLAAAKAPASGNADANFGALVGNGEFYSGGTSLLQVALNNLTVGDSYVFQLLLVDGRSGQGNTTSIYQNSDDITNSIAPIATATIHYADNTTIGGYIDASFVADATSQSFYVQTFKSTAAAAGGNVQALVLQDQTVAGSVPEPASLGILAVGVSCLLGRRRR